MIESPTRSKNQRGYDRWESGSYRRSAGRGQQPRGASVFEDWNDKADQTRTWESSNAKSENRYSNSGHAAILPQQSDAPKREKKTEATYKPGMRVKHPSFGEGLIINVRLEGDGEETVDIFFAEIKQQKKLAASFVKLEILG